MPDIINPRVVMVTGPAGSGRSTAINALEDAGFEAIDNLPLALIPRLLDGTAPDHPIALGVDTRTRGFSASACIEIIDKLSARDDIDLEVLFLDCSQEVLLRRYSETRRRHPLAPEESPLEGIKIDNDLLAPVRVRADILIDTSEMTPHDLKADIQHFFMSDTDQPLAVSVHSFSYKRGLPRGLDMVFDCRFLNNPHWEPALRPLDGRDAAVLDYVQADGRFAPFFDKVSDLVESLLPAYTDEGKAHLSIGFGCTGGQHRSVALAETLTQTLAQKGWRVSIRHREIERRSAAVALNKG